MIETWFAGTFFDTFKVHGIRSKRLVAENSFDTRDMISSIKK
jgi:hypothetical protein